MEESGLYSYACLYLIPRHGVRTPDTARSHNHKRKRWVSNPLTTDIPPPPPHPASVVSDVHDSSGGSVGGFRASPYPEGPDRQSSTVTAQTQAQSQTTQTNACDGQRLLLETLKSRAVEGGGKAGGGGGRNRKKKLKVERILSYVMSNWSAEFACREDDPRTHTHTRDTQPPPSLLRLRIN